MLETDLFRQLIPSLGDQGTPAPPKVPPSAQIKAGVARLVAVAARCGLPDAAPANLVAVSRADDLELDSAYVELIQDFPEVAQAAPDPAVFDRLARLSAALAALDESAAELALKALQAAIDMGVPIAQALGKLEALLAEPADTVLAPGFTVDMAVALFQDTTLRVNAPAAAAAAEKERQQRAATAEAGTAQAAAQNLQGQRAVQRLAQAARQGALPAVRTATPAPAPHTGKKGATAGGKAKKAPAKKTGKTGAKRKAPAKPAAPRQKARGKTGGKP